MKVPVVEGMSSGRHILLRLQCLIASFSSYLRVACMNMRHCDLQLFSRGWHLFFSITQIINNFLWSPLWNENNGIVFFYSLSSSWCCISWGKGEKMQRLWCIQSVFFEWLDEGLLITGLVLLFISRYQQTLIFIQHRTRQLSMKRTTSLRTRIFLFHNTYIILHIFRSVLISDYQMLSTYVEHLSGSGHASTVRHMGGKTPGDIMHSNSSKMINKASILFVFYKCAHDWKGGRVNVRNYM